MLLQGSEGYIQRESRWNRARAIFHEYSTLGSGRASLRQLSFTCSFFFLWKKSQAQVKTLFHQCCASFAVQLVLSWSFSSPHYKSMYINSRSMYVNGGLASRKVSKKGTKSSQKGKQNNLKNNYEVVSQQSKTKVVRV